MAENNNPIRAGRICGNPLTGLCERVVIEVPRVFDGSVSRYRNKTFMLEVSVDSAIMSPYTFVSCESYGEVNFVNVVTTPLGATRTRIVGELQIPVSVRFKDANGSIHATNSIAVLARDIVLNTPASSIVPYAISNQAKLACDVGTFLSDTSVNIVACLVVLTKIIVCTDIVVPSYGRSVYPEIDEGLDSACDRVFNLEIFPPIE